MFSTKAAFGLALFATIIPAAASAQDSDGDGVNNAADIYPCDATISAVAYAPAQNVHGTIAVEDLWPVDFADLDFNDLQLSYHYEYRLDASGRVRVLRITYNVLAIGATLQSGFGLHLPVPRSALATARRTIDGASINLVPSTADEEVTLQISNDLRELFGDRYGAINSIASQPAIGAPPMIVELTFATPVTLPVAGAPHDVYVFRTYDHAHEIHRPEFAGTANMRRALFNTGVDASTAQRHFVDSDGLPYVLVFPERVAYPREREPIEALFPQIVTFAASGGTSAQNFYQSPVAGAAYVPSVGAAPVPSLVPAGAIDDSCVPRIQSTCLTTRNAGLSRGNGVYSIDLDGPGPQAAFDVYCDMTTDGGGWTLVERVVNGYHSGTGAVGTPAQLAARASHAKLADATIRALALAGQREALLDANSNYILRYSDSEWNAFASNGWTNVAYDAKRSNGTWVLNACNGHYNNRGFSSYSDASGSACGIVYSGAPQYISTYHTYLYAGGVGGVYEVFVR